MRVVPRYFIDHAKKGKGEWAGSVNGCMVQVRRERMRYWVKIGDGPWVKPHDACRVLNAIHEAGENT